MKKLMVMILVLVTEMYSPASTKANKSEKSHDNLIFKELANSWDEGIPLGNGIIGNLVWQKKGKLRFSIDRADLWDLRPMENIDFDKWKFSDLYSHWKNNTYEKIQQIFDIPYAKLPGPTKIQAGALEFDLGQTGKPKSVNLDIKTAICKVEWSNGTRLTTFVHANKPIGWFRFEGINNPLNISVDSPPYNRESEAGNTDHSIVSLNQLKYPQGDIISEINSLTYNQKMWGESGYQVYIKWKIRKNCLTGCWSISFSNKAFGPSPAAMQNVNEELSIGYRKSLKTHISWWTDFWNKSSIRIPDTLLQKQYMLEIYKFGSVARPDAPPISLQAVWTADHGKLPPWKGDYHNDLNTELSYWPAYTGNYLDLETGFLNWLWKYRPTFRKYTHDFWEVDGINVPGVATLTGEPMGGWVQFAFGPTMSCWLSVQFYKHWRFSMDKEFLKQKAYPWIKEVIDYLNNISVTENGKRKLKLSSSPEIFNNSRNAWFQETSNFDLALIKWTYLKGAEMAIELGKKDDASNWKQIAAEWPDFAVDPSVGLMFTPTLKYEESHRHFSHLMAFHPLGMIDFSNGLRDQEIINNTLKNLEKTGPDAWAGYSYSWLANLYARTFNGEKAVETLQTFARCFCLKNSFHANGDQCKSGYTKMVTRPFTLEGNFAFASAIQEMLIQSHTGTIKIFPAIPESWHDASFSNLRTDGAFLISAIKVKGKVRQVIIFSEKGGQLTVENPFTSKIKCNKEYEISGKVFKIYLPKGESAIFNADIHS